MKGSQGSDHWKTHQSSTNRLKHTPSHAQTINNTPIKSSNHLHIFYLIYPTLWFSRTSYQKSLRLHQFIQYNISSHANKPINASRRNPNKTHKTHCFILTTQFSRKFPFKRWLLKKLRAKKSIKKIALLFLCMFNKLFDADIRNMKNCHYIQRNYY